MGRDEGHGGGDAAPRTGRSPADGTAGKLSHVPSTLPLSVTGSKAALRPAQRSSSRPMLPLGLACLFGWLLPAGPALALMPARPPAEPSGRLQLAGGLVSPPAGAGAIIPIAAEAPPSPMQVQPAASPVQPAAAPPGGLPAAAPPSPTGPAAAGSPAAWTVAGGPVAGGPVAAGPISEADFQQLLRTADLDRLNLLCGQLIEAGDDVRLRLLRERLLTIHPAPQPLPVVLANAEVLLSCRMPDGALTVLDRIGPARGAEQVQWLTLQWRAANAALDHRRAALALERLAAERPARLENLLLPLQQRSDGSWASRSALEVLASHLESAGQATAAAALLQLSTNPDAPAAERLAQAARLLAELPAELREPLFERALEQAAAVGSWGLVGDLLAAQASLPASLDGAARTAERRLRLSRRLDDAYGEWRALQDAADPSSAERRQALRLQLRSPRTPGGHAEKLPPLVSEGGSTPGQARPGATAGGPSAAPASSPDTALPAAAISPSGSPVPSQP